MQSPWHSGVENSNSLELFVGVNCHLENPFCPFRILKLCGIERVAPPPGWYCYCSDNQSMNTFSMEHIRLYICIFQIHNMDLSCPSLLMDKLVLDETSDYGSRETSSEEGIGGLCQVEFKGAAHFSKKPFQSSTFQKEL